MASPQIENGYTRIANELLCALTKSNIRGSEFMIVLAVISKTYGYNKSKDEISLNQFSDITKCDRSNCARSIRNLIRMNILGSVKGDTSKTTTYWIQKDYDKWNVSQGSVKRLVSKVGSVKSGPQVVSKVGGQVVSNAYNTQKTIQQKTIQKTSAFDFDALWIKYPRKLGKHDAQRHFNAQVKNQDDFNYINTALENFLNSTQAKGDPKFIPHGSSWFNHKWRDWVEYQDPQAAVNEEHEILVKAGMINDATSRIAGKRSYHQES